MSLYDKEFEVCLNQNVQSTLGTEVPSVNHLISNMIEPIFVVKYQGTHEKQKVSTT